MSLTLILGGARAGKSRHGQERAERAADGRPVLFVATATAGDGEMAARIARHQEGRPAHWRTIEEPLDVAGVLRRERDAGVILVDCLTFFVTNHMLRAGDAAHCDADVWDEAGAEAAVADALVRRLSIYRLRRRIAIARDPALGVFWQADACDRPADPRLPALGHRWIAPIGADDRPVDAEWLAHRLAQGVAEGQAELGSDATLWLETNAAELGGVSFTKGCYVGQENTARMNWRQKVNRRLVVVPIDQSRPDRQRAAYPALGLAVDHLRIEDIAHPPEWMKPQG